MTEYEIKQEDTLPVFELELTTDGSTYSLDTANEVRLYVEHPGSDTLVVNEAMTITDAANGIVEYQFTDSETTRDGYHYGEVVVDEPDGDRSFPDDGFYELKFNSTLDRNASVEAIADKDVDVTSLTASDYVKVGDDTSVKFGDADDFAYAYDSGADAFVLTEDGVGSRLTVSVNGAVDVPNSTLSEQGNRVATRTWSTSTFLEDAADSVARSNIAPTFYTQSEANSEFLEDVVDSVERSNILPSFYTQTEATDEFVNAAGDSMSGNLDLSDNILTGANTVRLADSSGDGVVYEITELGGDGNFTIQQGDGTELFEIRQNGAIETHGRLLLGDEVQHYGSNGRIGTAGSGSDLISVYDHANAQDLARFNEGGPVEFPNTNVNLGGNQLDAVSIINFYDRDGDGTAWRQYESSASGAFKLNDGTNDVLVGNVGGNVSIPNGNLDLGGQITGGPNINTDGNNVSIYDTTNSQFIFSALEGGNIEIPNGNLNFTNRSDILNVHNIKTDSASSEFIGLWDSYNGQHILKANVGGNVSISNGTLDLQGYPALTTGKQIRASDTSVALATDGSGGSEWLVYDRANSQVITRFNEGGNVEIPHGSITQGSNPAETITESTSPKSFNFDGSDDRDILDQIDIHLENTSASSSTETVNVDFYDGADSTGTLVASNSRDISLDAGATAVTTIIFGDNELDTGTYYVEVTTSGTDFAVNQSDASTKGASYTFEQTAVGDLQLTNQDGTTVLETDAISEEIRTNANDIRLGEQGSIYDFNEIQAGKSSSRITTAGGGSDYIRLYDLANFQSIVNFHEGGNVEIPNGGVSVTGGNLDLQKNDLLVRDIFLGARNGASLIKSNGQDIRIYDSTNGQDIAKLLEGGNVEVPNGNLDILGNNLTGVKDVHSASGVNTFGPVTSGANWRVYDSTNKQGLFYVNEGGNVEVPNGTLKALSGVNVGDNNITNINNLVKNDSRVGISFKDPTDGTLVGIFDSQRKRTLGVRQGNIQMDNSQRITNGSNTSNSKEMTDHMGVGDTSKVQLLSVASDTGKVLVVNRTSGASAEFFIDGVNGNTHLLNDPDGAFTTTEGNAGTTNIYWDGTNAQFELNNETAATADYSVHLLA